MIFKKTIFICTIIGLLIGAYTLLPAFITNICIPLHPKYHKNYCSQLGKQAVVLYAPDYPIVLGDIREIRWYHKGSPIHQENHEARTAPKDDYYYVIGSAKSNYVFMHQIDQVDALLF